MERINITLTKRQLSALRRYREKTGNNISLTIRRLVEQFLFAPTSDGHSREMDEIDTKEMEAVNVEK
jgi:hypothetical protein